MRKVKSYFKWEIHYLYYLNNKLINTFTNYQELVDYCNRNNFNLTKSTGL